MKKILNNNRGYTMLEMLIATSLFIVVLTIVLQTFNFVTEGQRKAVASQNIQESTKYFMEYLSKELRSAQMSKSFCNDAVNATSSEQVFKFDTSNKVLFFKNKYGQCIYYWLDTAENRIVTRRNHWSVGGPEVFVTPDNVEITNFNVVTHDDSFDEFHSIQPRATIIIEANFDTTKSQNKSPKVIQTTVSSRLYE